LDSLLDLNNLLSSLLYYLWTGENLDANLGSRSQMIETRIPCLATTSFSKSVNDRPYGIVTLGRFRNLCNKIHSNVVPLPYRFALKHVDTNTLDELGAKEETVEAKIYMS
nr:hypothetical protein [Tanacetum cinerariifolium]